MTQTKREIQAFLDAAGVRPLKRFGQNFLIDGNLMRFFLATADVQTHDVVVEVGPGTGSLTEELIARAGHVIAVEIDHAFQEICRSRFQQAPNFTLIARDVLERKSQIAPELYEAMRCQRDAHGGRLMLVANLPYQVATSLIIDLLLSDLRVTPMCFTVQAEMADRLVAEPDSKTYGPISIYAQALARVEIIRRVPPEAFWPAPKVESAMVRLDRHEPDALHSTVQQSLVALVHHCFLHRRKTLRANLRTFVTTDFLASLETDGRWDLGQRPENLNVAQWIGLARWRVEQEAR